MNVLEINNSCDKMNDEGKANLRKDLSRGFSEKANLGKDLSSRISDNFDESTFIAPNKNGEKEKGKIDKIEYEIKKESLIEFIKNNSIAIQELFLAGLSLTLNKFNFSTKTLIFNENDIPFATAFENREISINEFLREIHEDYNESLNLEEYENSTLSPEFYYSFDERVSPQSKLRYSNYLTMVEDDEAVSLTLYYNNELYTEDYIYSFLFSLEKIIKEIINADIENARISDIAIEREDDDISFSEVELPFLHKRFERQVKETPNNISLIASDGRLTYNELNQKANAIANALIKKGIKPRSNVLIMLKRDSNLIAAVLGILKAGCAFVPLDIQYPKGRIQYILENCDADYIIADGKIENSIDVNDLLNEENISNPDIDISSDDLAYMIYTSGSTGAPKGVMISHKNITNLFSESEDNLIYNAYKDMNKTLALSTVSFDAFLLDFMPLTFGSQIVLANDNEIKNIKELTDLIKRERPESLTLTVPSRLKQYLEYEEFEKGLVIFKYIGIGGEKEKLKDFLKNKKNC